MLCELPLNFVSLFRLALFVHPVTLFSVHLASVIPGKSFLSPPLKSASQLVHLKGNFHLCLKSYHLFRGFNDGKNSNSLSLTLSSRIP